MTKTKGLTPWLEENTKTYPSYSDFSLEDIEEFLKKMNQEPLHCKGQWRITDKGRKALEFNF